MVYGCILLVMDWMTGQCMVNRGSVILWVTGRSVEYTDDLALRILCLTVCVIQLLGLISFDVT